MEIDIVYIILSLRLNTLTIGKINSLTVDSSIQPNASEQSVMPSWHAERYGLSCLYYLHLFALLLPSVIMVSILELRSFTIANSRYKKHLSKQTLLL